MSTIEVILTEKIDNLGAEADVVKVKRGFARNFLVPSGKALEVTPATLRRLNQLKTKRAEREARELNEAEELGRRINKLKVTLTLATGETGKAFGSITAQDIAAKIESELGVTLDRHKIDLERPLKEVGEHEVIVRLHSEVTSKLSVTLKSASEEEGDAAEGEESEEGGFKAKAKAKHNR